MTSAIESSAIVVSTTCQLLSPLKKVVLPAVPVAESSAIPTASSARCSLATALSASLALVTASAPSLSVVTEAFCRIAVVTLLLLGLKLAHMCVKMPLKEWNLQKRKKK